MWRALAVVLLVALAGCASSSPGGNSPTVATARAPTTASPLASGTVTGTAPSAASPSPSPTSTPTATATATMTPSPTPTPVPANPWGKEPVVVGINNSVAPRQDFEPAVRRAIEYWEENDDRYGRYQADFVLVPDARDPDVVVRFVRTLSYCGEQYGEIFFGCAPVLSQYSDPPSTAVVRVQAGLTDESTTLVLKHEFGHVLGLGHDDEPQSTMSHDSRVLFRTKPDAVDREWPWRNTTFTVYIDYGRIEDRYRDETERQAEHALEHYADGADGFMPRDVAFVRVDRRDRADIRLEFTRDTSTGGGSDMNVWGIDLDTDERLEYYTNATIAVDDVPVETRGWHVGYWLGFLFGADSIADLPPSFDDPEEDERTEWWD